MNTFLLLVIACALVWIAIHQPRGTAPARPQPHRLAITSTPHPGRVYGRAKIGYMPAAPRWCGELVAHDPQSGRRAPCVLPQHHHGDHAATMAALQHTGILFAPPF